MMNIKDSENLDFLDYIGILSFLIGIQNLDLNITQNDLQSHTETLDKALRTEVKEIHKHLEEQDKLMKDILLELQERGN